MAEKTIMKLYDNGDVEALVPISQRVNLFDLTTSLSGYVASWNGNIMPVDQEAVYTPFIPVEVGATYTIEAWWKAERIPIQQYGAWSMVYGYNANNTPIRILYETVSDGIRPVVTYHSGTFTIPSDVAFVRVSANMMVNHGYLEFKKGTPKSISFSENTITLPTIIQYSTTSPMPSWAIDTGNPVSIFPEGIVIKGNFIETEAEPDTEYNLPPLNINNVIYMHDNFMVTSHDGSLHLSEDGGLTFTKSMPIRQDVGIIKYCHIFSDGTLLFCSNTKAYYSTDFSTYSESTILDMNDSPLELLSGEFFGNYTHDPNRQIVNGVEMLVWGNYHLGSAAPIVVWYTTDKGRTIKIAYQFNQAGTNRANHIHNVVFNSADNSFWILTGDDAPTEHITPHCHFMKCFYDTVNDSWTFETVGSGLPHKSGNMFFVGEYAYWSWDTPIGGVIRCKYDEIGDTTKYEQIMQTVNDCLGMYMSERGEFIVTQSFFGGSDDTRYIWYSPDRVTFHKILTTPDVEWNNVTCYYGFRGPNKDGRVLAGVANYQIANTETWDLKPTVFLDEFVRNAGFPNAFRPL